MVLVFWWSIEAHIKFTVYNFWVNSFDHVFKLFSVLDNKAIFTIPVILGRPLSDSYKFPKNDTFMHLIAFMF